ncbi:MAG: hypothetical protein COT81_02990 [Candidatus Buchananbacteria bacterium CG10_big_fil_rev_8_21_14_0_10_42_9]|uniref:Nucleoside 2-deoxyribosyltransferase n=1 Tax=Candidatus Buchananbacteria bacterium CG10_big_fil_rev_8_21_14_0_10_42_9 TaxID=1974526 RepID=A0A2H0W180_9BACT|nr:MAG: hypothetical protein COT81_02990 [Candidatus Buchananbacteria bacterium CG10_big_fil_rev_8_21_14_0_10_42_9]
MTDYSIVSSFRNKDQCLALIEKLKAKGKTCYNFSDTPADPNNPNANPEEQMKAHEAKKDFYNDEHFKYLFEKDLAGLKNAKTVILLLPAGTSAHIEAGIAYGMGKPLILIGEAAKPESLYLIFQERYKTAEEFLANIN